MIDTSEKTKLLSAFVSLVSSTTFQLRNSGKESLVEFFCGQFTVLLENLFIVFDGHDNREKFVVIGKIENILEMIEFLSKAGQIDQLGGLIMERQVLDFKKLFLDYQIKHPAPTAKMKAYPQVKITKPASESNLQAGNLKKVERELTDFISQKGEISNTEIFSFFPGLSKRSLKRHLSGLTSSRVISRKSEGKKVFYKIS